MHWLEGLRRVCCVGVQRTAGLARRQGKLCIESALSQSQSSVTENEGVPVLLLVKSWAPIPLGHFQD